MTIALTEIADAFAAALADELARQGHDVSRLAWDQLECEILRVLVDGLGHLIDD